LHITFDPFQIMGALKHHDIASQKPLTDATEQAKEIAAAGPNAFHRIVMDFANTITVIVTRPLTASGRMADGLVDTSSGGKVPIGRPLISVDDRIRAGMRYHEWFKRGAIAVATDAKTNVPTMAPDNSDNRWTITGPCPMAARLISPATRWVKRVGVFAAFLTSVLIEFVSFENDGRTMAR
jgi:hypothetical protein